jgi:hypothetical protein
MELYKDLKLGRLTLIIETKERRSGGYVVWECKCDCGEFVKKATNYLRNQKSKLQCNKCSIKSQIPHVTKHNFSNDFPRLYHIALNARNRCKENGNKDYGARGIKFKFESIRHFIDWSLQNGYEEHLTIERKDVNSNYCPENCCWITKSKQTENKTTTIEFMGMKCHKEIAKSMGITPKALQAMIYKKKMTLEEIYQSSINDPTFHMSLYEKTSVKAMSRKHEWKLNKENVEDVIIRISKGETRKALSRFYKVDYNTIVKSIKRYEDGYYN